MTYLDFLNFLIIPINLFVSGFTKISSYLFSNYFFITYLGIILVSSLLFYFLSFIISSFVSSSSRSSNMLDFSTSNYLLYSEEIYNDYNSTYEYNFERPVEPEPSNNFSSFDELSLNNSSDSFTFPHQYAVPLGNRTYYSPSTDQYIGFWTDENGISGQSFGNTYEELLDQISVDKHLALFNAYDEARFSSDDEFY